MTKSQWGRRGASSAFALIIFLMTTLFSITMVNGALTAVQNASLQRVDEQSYLCVTSAARLFCDQALFRENLSYRIDNAAPVPLNELDNINWTLETGTDTLIERTFRDMMAKADAGLTGTSNTHTLTFKKPADVANFYDVSLTLTMNDNYIVTAQFETLGVAESLRYYVSLTCKGIISSTLVTSVEDENIPPLHIANNFKRQMTWTVEVVERGRR